MDKNEEDKIFINTIYNDVNLETDLLKYKPTLNEPKPFESNFMNNNEVLNFEEILKDNNLKNDKYY